MQVKTKIILIIGVIGFYCLSCISAYFIGKHNRPKIESDDYAIRLDKVIKELERERAEKEQIINQLTESRKSIDESIQRIDSCSTILGECEKRIESCENSLDGLEQCIRVYEESIRELSEIINSIGRSTEK